MNPTPARWTAKLPNLKQAGGQFEGPCPLCGGTDRFHVNLKPPHLFGCRQCEDGPAILRAVFGERQKRKPLEECIDAEYETADGLRHKAYRMDWPGDWGGQPCDWKDRGKLCTRSSAHKHTWEQKHKGRRGRPAGLKVAFWSPEEPGSEVVVVVEGPKTARAVRETRVHRLDLVRRNIWR